MTPAAERPGAGGPSGGGADLTLRVAASTYVMVIVVYGALAAFTIHAALDQPTPDWVGPGLVLVLVAAFLIFLLARLRLTVSGGVLRYRNLFGERVLPLTDIVRTEFRRKPFARDPRPIVLITSEGRAKPVQVNLMPFRRDDTARLLALPALKLEK